MTYTHSQNDRKQIVDAKSFGGSAEGKANSFSSQTVGPLSRVSSVADTLLSSEASLITISSEETFALHNVKTAIGDSISPRTGP